MWSQSTAISLGSLYRFPAEKVAAGYKTIATTRFETVQIILSEMEGILYPGQIRRGSKAFGLIPEDIWFEVVDYLPVTDIVHLRGVSISIFLYLSIFLVLGVFLSFLWALCPESGIYKYSRNSNIRIFN